MKERLFRTSLVPERHSQDHQHDPKGYHFRQGLATDLTKTTMINLHACYCALFADIEQKSPFLFAGIK